MKYVFIGLSFLLSEVFDIVLCIIFSIIAALFGLLIIIIWLIWDPISFYNQVKETKSFYDFGKLVFGKI